jgi:hypothetical protein
LNIHEIVGDEKFTVHKPDIGFHAGEALFEGIEERAVMLVVVVSMGGILRDAEGDP